MDFMRLASRAGGGGGLVGAGRSGGVAGTAPPSAAGTARGGALAGGRGGEGVALGGRRVVGGRVRPIDEQDHARHDEQERPDPEESLRHQRTASSVPPSRRRYHLPAS